MPPALSGGGAYVISGKNGSELIEKDISQLYAAENGVYLAGSDGKLYYYGGGRAERFSRNATVADCYGMITNGS